jgi:beta-mannanase
VLAVGALEPVDTSSRSARLSDVANGTYDASTTNWMTQARGWGHPFLLRWDWEMEGGWFPWGTTSATGNTPADYVAAWRQLHDLGLRADAANVTWVWCPNLEFAGATALEQVYPGDGYVDWACIDGYNQGSSSTSFAGLFGSTYSHILRTALNKPVMVGETASQEFGGAKAAWIADALSQLPTAFPKVKAFLWFNWRISEDGSRREWPIESSASAQAAFFSGIASPYFAPGGAFGSLPPLTKIVPRSP